MQRRGGEVVEEVTGFDPNGEYKAALGIQTCDKLWVIRSAYFSEKLNSTYGTDEYAVLQGADPSADGAKLAGDFTDVEIKGNGTYTVKLENADFSGEKTVSQLYVATNIPVNDQIKVTNFIVEVNGKKIVKFDEATLEDEKSYTEGGMIILAINHWRSSLVSELESLDVYEEDGTSGVMLLKGDGTDNVTLTFTISGFAYDNPDATVEETATPTPTETVKATTAPDTSASANTDDAKSGNNTMVIVIVVVAVVAVVAVAGVVISKKKKTNK